MVECEENSQNQTDRYVIEHKVVNEEKANNVDRVIFLQKRKLINSEVSVFFILLHNYH